MCWSVHDHKRKLIFEDARYVRTTTAFVNQFLTICTYIFASKSNTLNGSTCEIPMT
jgi:hypothetical protein